LLAIASMAVLIYFIHHVATSIRIETQLANLAAETRVAIDRLYPERMGDNAAAPGLIGPATALPDDFETRSDMVRSHASGYVQLIDDEVLIGLASERDLIIRVEARPGRFVTEGDALLAVYPKERLSDEAGDQLRAALAIGPERTPEQDLEFSIRRIVEIAQRSLSPGVNDPTTALYCIDRLGETLGRLAGRDLPSPMRFDDKQRLRIVTEVTTLDDLAVPAFAAVARYGMEDGDVVAKLLDTMDLLVRAAPPRARIAIAELRDEIGSRSRKGPPDR
jgi:uncharacterized membrane protein